MFLFGVPFCLSNFFIFKGLAGDVLEFDLLLKPQIVLAHDLTTIIVFVPIMNYPDNLSISVHASQLGQIQMPYAIRVVATETIIHISSLQTHSESGFDHGLSTITTPA